MKANTRVASVALMLGLFGSALVGGASMAQATGGYSCSNGLANVVTCNNTVAGIPVTLNVTGNRTLTGNEIGILQNNLNNTAVNVTAIKNSVFNTYASFNPTVIIKKINVCIASVCS
ncbi:hypothetical protein ACQP2T_41035 [Nonomuraea sp. CA-143628]|uniref:hypothetical protein n=1 Tax=Nonomuraea sp. CA-143628 TaxID=3239997 RepID=UPI003D8AD05F